VPIGKGRGKKKQRPRRKAHAPIAGANAAYRAGFDAWVEADAGRTSKPRPSAGAIAFEGLPEGVAVTRANHDLRAAMNAAVQTYALLANRATKNAEQLANRHGGERSTLHAQLVRLLPETLATLQRLSGELEDALGIYASLRIDSGAPAAKRARPATKKGLQTILAAVLQEIPDEVATPAELVAWLRKHGHKVTRQEVDAAKGTVRKRSAVRSPR
jgi:hypothetical protein